MRVTATGSGEAQTGYDTKRSGAVKVHTLVAPPFGNGSDGLFMLFLLLSVFLLSRLLAKFPHKRGNI